MFSHVSLFFPWSVIPANHISRLQRGSNIDNQFRQSAGINCVVFRGRYSSGTQNLRSGFMRITHTMRLTSITKQGIIAKLNFRIFEVIAVIINKLCRCLAGFDAARHTHTHTHTLYFRAWSRPVVSSTARSPYFSEKEHPIPSG
jgi:hypothetical protein